MLKDTDYICRSKCLDENTLIAVYDSALSGDVDGDYCAWYCRFAGRLVQDNKEAPDECPFALEHMMGGDKTC